MNTSFNSDANRIRTKLLLFIDKELRSRKNNIISFNLMTNQEGVHYINSEQTYTEQYIEKYSFNFEIQQKKRPKKSNMLNSTCDITPTSVKSKYYNTTIHIKEKIYSIKKTFKLSSTFQIIEKPKTGKEYLKFLCDTLKIPPKTFIFPSNPLSIKKIRMIYHKSNESDSKRIPSPLNKKVKFNFLSKKKEQIENIINIKYQNPSRIKLKFLK